MTAKTFKRLQRRLPGRILTRLGVLPLCALLMGAGSSGDVLFQGDVTTSCSIVVDQNGLMISVNGNTRLSTGTNYGGLPGRATVTATGNNYILRVQSPTSFTSNPVEDLGVTNFMHQTWGSGADSFIIFQSNSRVLKRGTTNLMLVLWATKPGNAVFAAGDYTAQTTLTCE